MMAEISREISKADVDLLDIEERLSGELKMSL